MSKRFILTTSHGTAHFSETGGFLPYYMAPHSRRWQPSCQDSLRHNEYALSDDTNLQHITTAILSVLIVLAVWR